MTTANQLQSTALALMHKNKEWFGDNDVLCLQAWIRDGGRCAYCDRYLFETYDLHTCTDHLLPKKYYPQFRNMVENLVPCCTECNQLKRDWKLNEDAVPEITEEIRAAWLAGAKEYVDGQRSRRGFRDRFEQARSDFNAAVESYKQVTRQGAQS